MSAGGDGLAREPRTIAGESRARAYRRLAASRLRWLAATTRAPGLRRGGPRLILERGVAIELRPGGELVRGRDVFAARNVSLAVGGRLELGAGTFLGAGTVIACFDAVTIGEGSLLGERVSVHDENHVVEPRSALAERNIRYATAPVTIGRHVWLGANVVVLPGVTIGDDTTVAAGSVVTRDLPAGVLAAGAPATVRRELRP